MATVDSKLRSFFRHVPKNDYSIIQALDNARRAVSSANYGRVIDALKIAAPSYRRFPTKQPKVYADLLYRGRFTPLGIAEELAWADIWLGEAVPVINAHLLATSELQEMFAGGNLQAVSGKVDRLVAQYGWSFWAAELMFAVTARLEGDNALRNLAKKLQLGGADRASSLFGFVLTDRNDSTFPFESFQLKCMSSAQRFPDWFTAYFLYRSLEKIADYDTSVPRVLALDLSSSIIDYYEDVIFVLDLIRSRDQLKRYTGVAIGLARSLQRKGIVDHRLTKLRVSLGEEEAIQFREDHGIQSNVDKLHELLTCGAGDPEQAASQVPFLSELQQSVVAVDQAGAAAEQDCARLIGIGFNFKSLPIGRLIARKSFSASRSLVAGPIIPPGADLVLPGFDVSDLLVTSDLQIKTLIARGAAAESSPDQGKCKRLDAFIAGSRVSTAQIERDQSTVWLTRYLTTCGRIQEAQDLIGFLDGGSKAWQRQALKLRLLLTTLTGELEAGLKEAGNVLAGLPASAPELDLQSFFRGRRWADFRNVDPTLVGLVAHFANRAEPNPEIRFICRMACRGFYKTGAGKDLEGVWSRATDSSEKSRLIGFLRDAWTEENLALLETFKSTQEIRLERIRVLQYLLAWDPEFSNEYSSEIKELTIDETLWQGIQRVNQTRVFVNEAAITRWAEKELLPEFERLHLLRLTGQGAGPLDTFRSNYECEKGVVPLVSALPADEQTAANAILLTIVVRLYNRFLLDPTDGLDSFLSSRVRHGTLRGTLLGPLEESNLLIIDEAATPVFVARWEDRLGPDTTTDSLAILKVFSERVSDFVRDIVNSKIHIQGHEFPDGAFLPAFAPTFAPGLVRFLSGDDSFQFFLSKCYSIFWAVISLSRQTLASYFEHDVKEEFQRDFEELRAKLREKGAFALLASVQTASTAIQAQCNVVRDWFLPQQDAGTQTYELSEAIEIGRRATANVYRLFSSEVKLSQTGCEQVSISAYALTILVDCLFIAFENAWRHSGLSEALGTIQVSVELNREIDVLTLTVLNNLSDLKRYMLKSGELTRLHEAYLTALPVELVPREGGSGLAKLARVAATVDRGISARPFDFGVDDEGRWFVMVQLKLRNREGTYDVAL